MSSEPNSTTPSLLKYLTPDNDNNSSFDTLDKEPIRNFDIELAKLTYHENSKKRARILHLANRINDNIDSLKNDLQDNQYYFKIQSQFESILNNIITKTEAKRQRIIDKATIEIKAKTKDDWEINYEIDKVTEKVNEDIPHDYEASKLSELKDIMKQIDLKFKKYNGSYIFNEEHDYTTYKKREDAWYELNNFKTKQYKEEIQIIENSLYAISHSSKIEIAHDILKLELQAIRHEKQSKKINKQNIDLKIVTINNLNQATTIKDLENFVDTFNKKYTELEDSYNNISRYHWRFPSQDLADKFNAYQLDGEYQAGLWTWENQTSEALRKYEIKNSPTSKQISISDDITKLQERKIAHLMEENKQEILLELANTNPSKVLSFKINAHRTTTAYYFQIPLILKGKTTYVYYRKTDPEDDLGNISKSTKQTFLNNWNKGKDIIIQNYKAFQNQNTGNYQTGLEDINLITTYEFPSQSHNNNSFRLFKAIFQIPDHEIASDKSQYLFNGKYHFGLQTEPQTFEHIFNNDNTSYSIASKAYEIKSENIHNFTGDNNVLVLINSTNNSKHFYYSYIFTQIGQFLGYKKSIIKSTDEYESDQEISIVQKMLDDEIILIPNDKPHYSVINWKDNYNIIAIHNKDIKNYDDLY